MPDLTGDGDSTTNNNYTTIAGSSSSSTVDQAFADLIMEQSAIQVNALAEMKKQNRLLTEINTKTG